MRVDELHALLVEEAGAVPVTVADPVSVVVRRARSARRRRAGFVVAAGLLAAVAVAASVTASRGTKHSDVIVERPRARLDVVALVTRAVPGHHGLYTSDLFYVDPETGLTLARSIPSNNFADYPVQLYRIGSQLLMPGGNRVLSAPFDLSSPPREIAPGLVFVPSANPDRIWAITHFGLGNIGPYKVTEFDASGHPTTKELALPTQAGWPIAGTNEGLLVSGTGDEVLLWDPVSGRVIRRITPVGRFGGDNWAGPDLFAWVSPCDGTPSCATLHFLDLRTGNQHDVAPPTGSNGFAPDGSLSPDAATLAVFTTTAVGSGQLVLVDVATGRITSVPDSDRATALITWSPDSATVFFGIDDATGIARFKIGGSKTQEIRRDLPRFSAIITGPATANTP